MIHVDTRVTRSVLLAALASALVGAPIASGGPERGAATLALQAGLGVSGLLIACPPDAPAEAGLCAQRSGGGHVPGLGFVMVDYRFFGNGNPSPSCGGARALHSTGQLTVPGKGTIRFDLERSEQCVADILQANQPFTITGGTDAFAGASGTGAVKHDLHEGPPASGTDIWSGTLTVPGLEFDLTPPILSGLVDKTVRAPRRAKRMRVKYRVTALDLIDGSVRATCKPGSGSRFKVGRTVVKCSATDTSANTVTGSFRVVVRRHR